MEEFNLDLGLDEAAKARIAHADFLNAIKEWGTHAGTIAAPFGHMAQVIVNTDCEPEDDVKQSIIEAIPLGVQLLIEHLNDLYEIIQNNAVKVLGAPFKVHNNHTSDCDGTKTNCGHQDHWAQDAE